MPISGKQHSTVGSTFAGECQAALLAGFDPYLSSRPPWPVEE
jgi:hypothetical protein